MPAVKPVLSALQEAEYGRARLWGAIGWGCLAPVAGALVTRCGMRVMFLCSTALAVLGFVTTVLLPIGALHKQRVLGLAAAGQPEAPEKPQPTGVRLDVRADSAAYAADGEAAVAAGLGAEQTAAFTIPAIRETSEDSRLGRIASAAEGHLRSEGSLVREVAAHVPLISAPELLVRFCACVSKNPKVPESAQT